MKTKTQKEFSKETLKKKLIMQIYVNDDDTITAEVVSNINKDSNYLLLLVGDLGKWCAHTMINILNEKTKNVLPKL